MSTTSSSPFSSSLAFVPQESIVGPFRAVPELRIQRLFGVEPHHEQVFGNQNFDGTSTPTLFRFQDYCEVRQKDGKYVLVKASPPRTLGRYDEVVPLCVGEIRRDFHGCPNPQCSVRRSCPMYKGQPFEGFSNLGHEPTPVMWYGRWVALQGLNLADPRLVEAIRSWQNERVA